jgi:Ca-activated chloride channel family protein
VFSAHNQEVIRSIVALGCTLALLTCAETARATPAESTLREEALVRRVQWPVRFVPKVPGGCDDVTAADLEVREDDVPVTPDGVERTRLDTIHAILIDDSGSMATKIGRAKEAAVAYIDRLPPGDQVLIASFSDNLVLHVPLTRDRSRVREALNTVEARLSTAFNDALYYTLRYLRARPERKVVVVLTDGCDTVSLPSHPLRYVRRLAEETDNLTVFPVGVSLQGPCAGTFGSASGIGPDTELRRLARRSGGRLFKVREAAGLHHVFGTIQKRMEQEGWVSYRPPAFGAGARDRADEREHRRRRVRVRSLVEDRCRVVSAGAATRLEGNDPRADRDVLAETDPLRPAFDTPLAFTASWGDESAAAGSHLLLAAGEIRGRSPDLLRERALLYLPVPYHRDGKLVPDPDRRVRIEGRDFRVAVPPFETVRSSLRSPEELLYFLLRHEPAPFRPPDGLRGRRAAKRWSLGATWVHGQTLLELRGFVGQALFGYEGYREFAAARLREEYLADMRRMLDEAARRWNLPPSRVRAVREAIEAEPPEPRPVELQRFLAEWLGDISAHRLVVGFEGWAANHVLDSRTAHADVDLLLRTIDRRWHELPDWFPPPTGVRIVSPLVPGYDAERRTVGFYRVVLPQPERRGPPEDLVPKEPLALTFVRTLGDAGDGLRVRGIDYARPSGRTRRRLVRRAKRAGLLEGWIPWREIPVVWLELGPGEPASAGLGLTVLFDPRNRPDGQYPTPVCIEPPRGAEALAAGLLARLPSCSPLRP